MSNELKDILNNLKKERELKQQELINKANESQNKEDKFISDYTNFIKTVGGSEFERVLKTIQTDDDVLDAKSFTAAELLDFGNRDVLPKVTAGIHFQMFGKHVLIFFDRIIKLEMITLVFRVDGKDLDFKAQFKIHNFERKNFVKVIGEFFTEYSRGTIR